MRTTNADNPLQRGYRSATMSVLETSFSKQVGIEVPLICGAMYPCSNPELIAAVSEAGGIGVIQPMAMIYVHKHELRAGIRLIRKLTDKPIGFNAIVEKSARAYEERMRSWVDIALEEGVRFFVTALGNPRWVADEVHAVGGVVYHNITERHWAHRALDGGVDGFICVNARAGGHAGPKSPAALVDELGDLGLPLICAGGIGDEDGFASALAQGYAGAQLGTRFIATEECNTHLDYKQAIVKAKEQDIVLTDKISGVPVAVIKTPYIERIGTKAGPIARRLLRHRKAKRYMRMFYSIKSMWQLREVSARGMSYKDFFQAGKSVSTIYSIESASDIVRCFAERATAAELEPSSGI